VGSTSQTHLHLSLQATGDKVKERRATRGLAACARMQGQLRQASAAWWSADCLVARLTVVLPTAHWHGRLSLQIKRKLQAVKHLERVLEISREIRDFVGDADAYGTIAGEGRLGGLALVDGQHAERFSCQSCRPH
jgi:hypothetical protein